MTEPFVSASCIGERCRCGAAAVHKVEEHRFWDDPHPPRHPLTAYVCDPHFREIMGPYRRHHYPTDHRPGSHWATTEGWGVLDCIKPGAIPDDVRMYLCGAIAGLLIKATTGGEGNGKA